MTGHILHQIEIILKQSYFQYYNQFFRQNKGITMGSPISFYFAEIYLQFLEERYTKSLAG